jgi:hypothetical protein
MRLRHRPRTTRLDRSRLGAHRHFCWASGRSRRQRTLVPAITPPPRRPRHRCPRGPGCPPPGWRGGPCSHTISTRATARRPPGHTRPSRAHCPRGAHHFQGRPAQGSARRPPRARRTTPRPRGLSVAATWGKGRRSQRARRRQGPGTTRGHRPTHPHSGTDRRGWSGNRSHKDQLQRPRQVPGTTRQKRLPRATEPPPSQEESPSSRRPERKN